MKSQSSPSESNLSPILTPEIKPAAVRAIEMEAQAVLDHNDRGPYITPSDELYGAGGNNWGYLWDTAFATMAIARYDPGRASKLFANFISTQHESGRIPHMAMWSSSFPVGTLATSLNWHGGRFKQQDLYGNTVKTSPVTQPPLLAVAGGEIMNALPDDHAKHQFASNAAQRLIKYHSWLYDEREIDKTGLVAVIHPHETGRDDAPSHVDLLHAIPLNPRDKLWLSKPVQKLIAANRTDKAADPAQRSPTDIVMRGAALAIFNLPKIYRTNSIPVNYPYQHIDPGFNAILDRANDELQLVADVGGVTIGPELRDAMQRTSNGLQSLWDPAEKAFHGIDVRGQVCLSPGQEVGDLLPIVSQNITPEQRLAITQKLLDPRQFGGDGLPSVSRSSDCYDSDRFWQGADWPQIRQLIMSGLYKSENRLEHQIAHKLGSAALRMGPRSRFAEYTDADSGEAKGAHNFSWAAGLMLYASKAHIC